MPVCDRTGKPLVAGRSLHGLVEAIVRTHPVLPGVVLGSGVAFEDGELLCRSLEESFRLAQALKARVVQSVGRNPGGQALELGPHDIGLPDITRGRGADRRPPVRYDLDEPDRLELADRLPDRGAADAKLPSEMLLAQPRPDRDIPVHHALLDPIGETIRKGSIACSRRRHSGDTIRA